VDGSDFPDPGNDNLSHHATAEENEDHGPGELGQHLTDNPGRSNSYTHAVMVTHRP
jgi:hypothetical protein